MTDPADLPRDQRLASQIANRAAAGCNGLAYIPAGRDYADLIAPAIQAAEAPVLVIDRPQRVDFAGHLEDRDLQKVQMGSWRALQDGAPPSGLSAVVVGHAPMAATPYGQEVLRKLRAANPDAAFVGISDVPARTDMADYSDSFRSERAPVEIGRLSFTDAMDAGDLAPTRAVHSGSSNLLQPWRDQPENQAHVDDSTYSALFGDTAYRVDSVFRLDLEHSASDRLIDMHQQHAGGANTPTLFVTSNPEDALILGERLKAAYGEEQVSTAVGTASRAAKRAGVRGGDAEAAMAAYQNGETNALVTTARMLIHQPALSRTEATVLARADTDPLTMMRVLRHGSAAHPDKDEHTLVDPGGSVERFKETLHQDPAMFRPIEISGEQVLPGLARPAEAEVPEESFKTPGFADVLADLKPDDAYLHEDRAPQAGLTERMRSGIGGGLPETKLSAYLQEVHQIEVPDGRPYLPDLSARLAPDVDPEDRESMKLTARRLQNLSGTALDGMLRQSERAIQNAPENSAEGRMKDGMSLVESVLAHRRGRDPHPEHADLMLDEGRQPGPGMLPEGRSPADIRQAGLKRFAQMFDVEEGEIPESPADNLPLYRGIWKESSRIANHLYAKHAAQTDPLLRQGLAEAHNDFQVVREQIREELAHADMGPKDRKTLAVDDRLNHVGHFGTHDLAVRGDIRIKQYDDQERPGAQVFDGHRWAPLTLQTRDGQSAPKDAYAAIEGLTYELRDKGHLRLTHDHEGWRISDRLARDISKESPALRVQPGRGIFQDVPVHEDPKEAASALRTHLCDVLRANSPFNPATRHVSSFMERAADRPVNTRFPEEAQVVKDLSGVYKTWRERTVEVQRQEALAQDAPITRKPRQANATRQDQGALAE